MGRGGGLVGGGLESVNLFYYESIFKIKITFFGGGGGGERRARVSELFSTKKESKSKKKNFFFFLGGGGVRGLGGGVD